jgi:hypothetical protein
MFNHRIDSAGDFALHRFQTGGRYFRARLQRRKVERFYNRFNYGDDAFERGAELFSWDQQAVRLIVFPLYLPQPLPVEFKLDLRACRFLFFWATLLHIIGFRLSTSQLVPPAGRPQCADIPPQGGEEGNTSPAVCPGDYISLP